MLFLQSIDKSKCIQHMVYAIYPIYYQNADVHTEIEMLWEMNDNVPPEGKVYSQNFRVEWKLYDKIEKLKKIASFIKVAGMT